LHLTPTAQQSSGITLGKHGRICATHPLTWPDPAGTIAPIVWLKARAADHLAMENAAAKPGMVTVQRRWFVPSEKLEEFRRRWDEDTVPALLRQKGFIRAELYESDVRGHWLTSIAWEDQTSRNLAFEAMAEIYNAFSHFERFAPETLTLLSSCEAKSNAK
jgi:hypothetical protein